MADRADRHALYQKAVQCPDFDMHFFVTTYKRLRGRAPVRLREDFCGTAHFAAAWVRGHRDRRALGVDLDEPTLRWAAEHVLARESPSVRQRITLRCADVLDVTAPKVDLCCAMNFSFCVFKSRELLTRYFRAVHQGLRRDGLFITELYGGPDAIHPLVERRKIGRVTYVWQQEKFNPITNETLCHIHFKFPDGSRLDRAFSYDWRLWSIPEVRECLLAAGFSRVDVYWEDEDDKGQDLGTHHLATVEQNQPTWLVYIAALK